MTSKANAFRVPKRSGERAIRLVDSLGVRDRNLKIMSDNGHIIIPIPRSGSREQTESVLAKIEGSAIIEWLFSPMERYPHTLSEALEGELTPDLLEALPHSVDIIGEIAIVEIPELLQSSAAQIGKGVLQVNRNVRTVLAKSGPISSRERTREYHLIAGDNITETKHLEQGLTFVVDVAKAYFSPRLSFEHSRVAAQVKENEIVIDMFAGVGPFSIQIAASHKQLTVYAIDVNPYAVRYLLRNIMNNHVKGKVVGVLGSADLIILSHLIGVADRVIMNLPAEADRFLETACCALKTTGGTIHYYTFSGEPELNEEARGNLLFALDRAHRKLVEMKTREVKSTAPHQWQIVVDLKVT